MKVCSSYFSAYRLKEGFKALKGERPAFNYTTNKLRQMRKRKEKRRKKNK